MEKKLLKLFKLADSLNEKQDRVFAQIEYCADNRKKLEICIRSKEDFSFIERCEINLRDNTLFKWESIVKLFESYVGGTEDE